MKIPTLIAENQLTVSLRFSERANKLFIVSIAVRVRNNDAPSMTIFSVHLTALCTVR